MIDLQKLKKVHLIGIGGIHVSALAKLLLARGVEVSGSDLVESDIICELRAMGVKIEETRNKKLETSDANMHESSTNGANSELPVTSCQLLVTSDKIDLVIYSDAVPESDLERMAAKKLGIPQMSSYDFVGELSKDYYTIAVSGTNGKSTTTAMLGLILEAAGLDPTVIVGTKVREWNGNLRIGKSKYLVTEADEYKAHMLKLHPKMIVLTNIEEDHLDFYRDLEDIVTHFKKYVAGLPKAGILIYNRDDKSMTQLFHDLMIKCKKTSYRVENGLLKLSQMSSNISNNHDEVFEVKLQVPGEFNKYNAAAAASAAKELGVSNEVIKKSFKNFKGTWRRFEVVGEFRKATIISDYAHHPTALVGTIRAAREFYQGRRLIAVFQPHQHNRTRKLFDDFVRALAKCDADILIVSEIYDVAGRTMEGDKMVSANDLVDAVRCKMSDVRCNKSKVKGLKSKVEFKVQNGGDLRKTRSMIVQYIKPGDVVLIMGAGDIDKVARGLIN